MNGTLKILFVEDVIRDAELNWREIEKIGIEFKKLLVDNRKDFLEGLKSFKPDIIISDYSLPQFDGMQALLLRNELAPQTPFIVVTGSVNEEVAVECMKAGADDYVIKEHLTRLPFAIKEALEQHTILIEKRAAELLLKENEEKLQSIFSAAPVGIGLVVGRVFIEVNDTFCRMTGYNRTELTGKNAEAIYAKDEQNESAGIVIYRHIAEKGTGSVETRFKCKDGRILNIFLSSTPLDKNDLTKGVTFIAMDITERKKAEEALHESRQLFQTLAQASPVGIFRTNLDGYTTYVNPKYLELTGLSVEEALGFGWINAVHPDDREILKGTWLSDIQSQKTSNAEFRFLKPDKSIVWVIGNAVPELIGSEIAGYIGTITDITKRKEVEMRLLLSKQIWENTFNAISDIVCIISPENEFMSINYAGERSLKMPQNEIIGRKCFELVHGTSVPLVSCPCDKSLKPGSEGFSEYEQDGRYYSLHAWPIYDDSGKFTSFVHIIKDITQRKQTEEALINEQKRLRTLIDNLPDPIYVLDKDGRKVIANKADVKNIGYETENEVLGKTDIELFPGKIGERGNADNISVISSGKAIIEREEDFIDRNGKRCWLLTSKIPLHDKDGLITGLVGIGYDITERKKAEEELIKAKEKAEEGDRLKTAFLHNISHEIRTPMNAIVGFCALLGEPDADAQSCKDYIEVIMQSSNHLLSIITDIMDISNIEANLVKVVKNEINVNSTLKSLCNQFTLKANEKKINLVCESEVPDSDALITTDSSKLTQILTNLVSNAVKFTDIGYVTVGCVVRDKLLEFHVSDTGIGISEEYHQKIFDRFYQVQHAVSRLYEGTGLGLAISKANVELMGGKIRLSSEPGKGTSFYFTIPYEKQVVEIPAVDKIRVDQGFVFKEKKTILVAEDIDSNFKLITYFLSSANTNIIRAVNGKEAVEIFLSNKNIDLVLMDIKMPVMDGYTAAKMIREKNSLVPIIAQTAYADDRMTAIECGCSGFISKPFDRNGLLKVISEFI